MSIGVGALQVEPLYVYALPPVSTAMQNVVDGHETEVRLSVAMFTGVGLHEAPPLVEVSTSPPCPTATQNEVDGHEIPPMLSWFETWLIVTGPDHAAAVVSEAVAAVVAGHAERRRRARHRGEGELRVVSTATGALHELPLNVIAFPAWSTAAQNEADGHEIAVSV